ncbi:DUF6326 family protein [Phenylobacterium sp. LjRoot225]|uniref:DUF6326 family protein n=1 Tax=Phenylobacterium sp. LjRoot225 TaxID=3342285 RepID=UPI003ED0C453
MRPRQRLADVRTPVKLKISALWTAVMFCYVYGDFFSLYRPEKIQSLMAGETPVGPVSQGLLFAFANLMAVPSAMIFLTLALPAVASRWANIVLGSIYTVIMVLAIQGAWAFYVLLGAVEIAFTGLIVWHAVRWPREAPADAVPQAVAANG